jgi:hypothetical protein
MNFKYSKHFTWQQKNQQKNLFIYKIAIIFYLMTKEPWCIKIIEIATELPSLLTSPN